jgi:hypothetical protein
MWHTQEDGLDVKGQLCGLLGWQFEIHWVSSCKDTWRVMLMQSLPALWNISWQDFNQLCLQMDRGCFEHVLYLWGTHGLIIC